MAGTHQRAIDHPEDLFGAADGVRSNRRQRVRNIQHRKHGFSEVQRLQSLASTNGPLFPGNAPSERLVIQRALMRYGSEIISWRKPEALTLDRKIREDILLGLKA